MGNRKLKEKVTVSSGSQTENELLPLGNSTFSDMPLRNASYHKKYNLYIRFKSLRG